MPVLSPHRSSSSGLTGSYRSTFSSSSIDRPYFLSSSYAPRITSYNERFTTRSYTDSDGRKVFSRSGSITEDGITTRYREETRETSLRRDSSSRDSGIGSIRENSILDIPSSRRDRDVSLTRSDSGRGDSRVSCLSVADTMAELRNKYSPANYVPAIHRKNNSDISRSKSINDIGLPPLENSVKKKVTDGLNFNNSSCGLPNNTVNNATTTSTNSSSCNNDNFSDDDNGNRPSVSEIRKKFDQNRTKIIKNNQLVVEGVKIAENRFKKLDKTANEEEVEKKKSDDSDKKIDSDSTKYVSTNSLNGFEKSKLKVSKKEDSCNENGAEFRGGHVSSPDSETTDNLRNSRTNNFASYISSKDFNKGDSKSEENTPGDNSASNGTAKKYLVQQEQAGETNDSSEDGRNGTTKTMNGTAGMTNGTGARVTSTKYNGYNNDVTTSPRLSQQQQQQRSSGLNSAGTSSTTGGNSILNRSSLEREEERSGYEGVRLSTSPVKHQGLNGLKNIGNTCFMNSVIQCLSNTKQLLEYVRKDTYIADINTTNSSMKGALIKAFTQVLKELWSEDPGDRVVNTVSLKSQIQRFAPRFMGYAQQDAQEFLRYLLEGLHEDVNRVTTKPTPILTEIDEKLSDADKSSESWQRYLRVDNSKIVDIFVGQLKSTLKCTHCGHCSVTFDPFWDLSLPIPQKAGPVRLSQCLESFTREETLDGDEKPTCSKCKERRKCTKSFSIQKFPKILVIHLKRFSPTERYRGKLSVTVDFPLEGLDMRNYAADNGADCRYNLYAISNHSGTTYSGHYTAYCRHPYSHTWHTYNDSRVSPISSGSIVSGEAYVLFYELDSKKAHL